MVDTSVFPMQAPGNDIESEFGLCDRMEQVRKNRKKSIARLLNCSGGKLSKHARNTIRFTNAEARIGFQERSVRLLVKIEVPNRTWGGMMREEGKKMHPPGCGEYKQDSTTWDEMRKSLEKASHRSRSV